VYASAFDLHTYLEPLVYHKEDYSYELTEAEKEQMKKLWVSTLVVGVVIISCAGQYGRLTMCSVQQGGAVDLI
jgi:hypothetical protein